jgi:hypothetical protein
MIIDRVYRGQRYVVAGWFKRARRDGTEATILRWQSACAECGEPFIVTTPVASSKFEPSRRCQKHKRPGKRVRGDV